jgi:CO dehydrogenase nickel-insertion accessory protein CooC1
VLSDTSAKGIIVARTIKHLSEDNKAVHYKSMGLILNRVRDKSEVENIKKNVNINILGWLPEDELIREFDFYGKSFLDFPDATMTYETIAKINQTIAL